MRMGMDHTWLGEVGVWIANIDVFRMYFCFCICICICVFVCVCVFVFVDEDGNGPHLFERSGSQDCKH